MDRAATATAGVPCASQFQSSVPNKPASRHLAAPNIPFLNRAESNVYAAAQRKEAYMDRKASAVWTGGLKDGKGTLSTDSGTLKQTQYSFSTRFENGVGTNPEELLAAAHAGCFTMALSGQLGAAGLTAERIDVPAPVSLEKTESGFAITESHLELKDK